MRFNPHEIRLNQTLENSKTQKSSKFQFGWGPLMAIFDYVVRIERHRPQFNPHDESLFNNGKIPVMHHFIAIFFLFQVGKPILTILCVCEKPQIPFWGIHKPIFVVASILL